MVIGFVVIALLLVTVLANASKAFLYRRSLMSWADGAAIVAAQSVAAERIYSGEVGDTLPLSRAGARSEVADYVRRHDLAGRFDDFAVAAVEVDPSGGTVTVTFTTRMPLIWTSRTTPITAEASTVAPLQ
jgi:hypothetical protein